MATANEVASRVLAMSDAERSSRDARVLADREMLLIDEDFEGLALSGPARVASSADALPLVLAIRQTGHRAWAVPRDMNTHLVAFDRDRRELFVAPCFDDPKAREYPAGPITRPPAPTGASAASIVADVSRLDARAVLGLPPRAARYRFAVIAFDWISNPIDVEVEGEPAPQASMREPHPAPADLDTAPRLPSYLPTDTPPKADGGWEADTLYQLQVPMLELALGRQSPDDPALLARGSVVVARDAALEGRVATVEGEAHAVVPLSFVVVRLGSLPARAAIAIPSYAPAFPGEPIRAAFALDLADVLDRPVTAGAHRAYAMLEGMFVGPLELEL